MIRTKRGAIRRYNPIIRQAIAQDSFLQGLKYGFAAGFLACLVVLSLLGRV